MEQKVVVAPTAVPPEDERSYYKVTEKLVKETSNVFHPNQYYNPDNPKHIFSQPTGNMETNKRKSYHVVIGMGTGGTISGIGKFLKKNSNIKIIGVDSIGSIFTNILKLENIKMPLRLGRWKG